MEHNQLDELSSRDRVASIEPCTTRPNPFAAEEAHINSGARKRQRTSRGSSGSRSADTARAIGQQRAQHSNGDETAILLDSSPPRTPTHTSNNAARSDVTPSRFTINLRTPRAAESSPSSPLSPTTSHTMIDVNEDKGTRISVESESDVVSNYPAIETPSSSPSAIDSPEVELVAMSEDIEYTTRSPPLAIIEDDELLIDPMSDFPYNEARSGEPIATTIIRLKRYLQHETVDSDECFQKLGNWIDRYLEFTEDSPNSWHGSYKRNREFWDAFPDLVHALSLRRTFFGRFLQDSTSGREAVTNFFIQFARLVGRFVRMDARVLPRYRPEEGHQEPEVASYKFLVEYNFLVRKEENVNSHIGRNLDIHYSWNWDHDVEKMMNGFDNEGGDIEALTKLSQGYLLLLPHFPRICDGLNETCRLAWRETLERRRLLERRQLSRLDSLDMVPCYEFFKVVSVGFEWMIEKHISLLTPQSAMEILSNLTEIYSTTLAYDIPSTEELLIKQSRLRPEFNNAYLVKTISINWRFAILRKLITSAQMQLRVSAVTTMCSDLLKLHSQHKGLDASQSPLLRYFAEFVIENKLIEYILSTGSHPEIINESKNILGFLIATKTYTNNLTDIIWKTVMTSQDPRVVEAIVRQMMKGCVNLYEYPGLLEICSKVSEIPIGAFTPILREFCEELFTCLVDKARQAGAPELDAPPYKLCVRLIQESSVVKSDRPLGYPEIQLFATGRLRYLLGYGPEPEAKDILYQTCLEDLSAKSCTSSGSICAIFSLLSQNVETDLRTLTTVHGLTDMVIGEFESIMTDRSRPHNANTPASLARRELLLSIIIYQPDTISTSMGKRLWDVLVGKDSRSVADRTHAWQVLNSAVKRAGIENGFIATCLKNHLPNLPPECFTLGALDFARAAIAAWTARLPHGTVWEDQDFNSPALEQLWRMILTAPPNNIDAPAIVTLVEVYMEARPIVTMPKSMARVIHLSLVRRCLNQLAAAATKLLAFDESRTALGSNLMDVVAPEVEFQEQETIFARSLAVLREFLKAYQIRPQFYNQKSRSVIPNTISAVEGEPFTVRYQSFDGNSHTEVRSLILGKLNTAASLLASLQQATGFKSYKIYHGGKEFVPDETAICKSLEDMNLNGLVLVQRREDVNTSSQESMPSDITLEGEIMQHLDELWGYLGMHERVAQEIYLFLIKFPVYEKLSTAFKNSATSYSDIFERGQPFKCLYAVHALRECIATYQVHNRNDSKEVARRAISFLVAAISDAAVLDSCGSDQLKDSVAISMVDCLTKFLREETLPEVVAAKLDDVFLQQLLGLLSRAQSGPSSENAVRLSCKLFEVLMESSLHNPALWVALKPSLNSHIVRNLILDDIRPLVRKTVIKQISDKCLYSSSDARVSNIEFRNVFWNIVALMIPDAINNGQQAEEVLSLALMLFKKILESTQQYPSLEKHMHSWLSLLISHNCKELVGYPDSFDIVAHGLTSLISCAAHFAKCEMEDEDMPERQPLAPSISAMAKKLFKKHLFPAYQKNDHTERLIQRLPVLNSLTRRTMTDTVFNLIKDDEHLYAIMVDYLAELVPYDERDEVTPYDFELSFTFDRTRSVRSPTGYVGLRNLSNTCYLNSLLTQLFMNVSFRDFMFSATTANSTNNQDLLLATQILFGNMQNSLKRFVDPHSLSQSIRTYEETNIDVSVQMDVDEFYNLLFDRWEGQVATNEGKRVLRSFYGGQLVQQVKSKECEHISERLEPFSAIQCDIKGKSTLQDSLQAYVDGEIMEGDNKYKCSSCDRHVDAVKRACLKDVPDNLIFHLKRFDFNLRTLQRSKINDYFSFPATIDMRPYKVEHIMESPNTCPEDIFELVGILVHAGTAESGHYYSFIRERPSNSKESWVEFNDDIVTSWTPDDMESSCFGGPDYRGSIDNGASTYDKNYSAYMLFYQRSSVLAAQKAAFEGTGKEYPHRLPLNVDLQNFIVQENEVLMRKYCLYDPSHAQFVLKMLANIRRLNRGQCSTEHKLEKSVLHMVLNHLDQVNARTKDLPDFALFMATIQNFCNTCVGCSADYLEWFCTHHEGLRNLILRTPEGLVRTEVASTIFAALLKVRQEAPWVYGLTRDDDGGTYLDDSQLLPRLVTALATLWSTFHSNMKAWPEYFGLLYNISSLGDEEAVVLINQGFLANVLEVITADANLQMESQYIRMLTNINKRVATRPISYESVIALLHRLLQMVDAQASPVKDNISRQEPAMTSGDGLVPLSYTEHSLLIQHWEGNNVHILTEKLLGIRQNEVDARGIIMLLLHWPESLDKHISAAIKSGIKAAPTFTPTGPFLRAALTYCEHSESRSGIERLLHRIAITTRKLDTNADGKEYLTFFRELQQLPSNLHEISKQELFSICMELLPIWAPSLLAYYEPAVRLGTAEYIEHTILKYGHEVDAGQTEEEIAKSKTIIRSAQNLALQCLSYLNETHVEPQREIVTVCYQSLVSIMERSAKFLNEDSDDENEVALYRQYFEDRIAVLTLVRKLTVEEADEEVSEWEGSDDAGYSSSQAELGDLNDIEVQL